MDKDCWDVVINDPPVVKNADWVKKDTAATVIKGLSVEDNQLVHIKKAKSAKESFLTEAIQIYKTPLGYIF